LTLGWYSPTAAGTSIRGRPQAALARRDFLEHHGSIKFSLANSALVEIATPVAVEPDAAGVLSRAVVRAARLLKLSQRQVAAILGVSDATASRLFAGRYLLDPARAKEWELARLFVRFYRALDALWGHEASAHTWLASPNLALGAAPADLLGSVEGLVRVVAYLDAARGRL
jgi:transcriptional regulator with XRE-family HTH domain